MIPFLPKIRRLAGSFSGIALLLVSGIPAAPATSPGRPIREAYARSVADLQTRLTAFHAKAKTLPATPAGTRTLRAEIRDARAAYKRMEYLVEQFHPEFAGRLNGAPLPGPDEENPASGKVVEPEGLQVLVEAVNAENPLGRRRALLRQTARAEAAAHGLALVVPLSAPEDREVFEALENQVLRAMTQGISGFDAPETGAALPETRISLEALRKPLEVYLPRLKQRDPALARRVETSLEKAIALLAANPDFASFDRLAFIREAGNPLYAALIDAHKALGIDRFTDLKPLRRPVSASARNLFARDFLDARYHAKTAQGAADTAMAALGRRLFFDTLLSADQKRACASCHDPRRAFSDGLPKSSAFGGDGTMARNAPSLSYAPFQSAQFWDLRATTLENQVGHVVEGPLEFHTDFPTLLRKLRNDPAYPDRFRAAFPGGEDAVSVETLTRALAAYLRGLERWNAPFDRYVRGESSELDPAARRGFNLFAGKALCATCHFAPAFNGTVPPRYLETESEVLGIPEAFPSDSLKLDPDPGRYGMIPSPVYLRAFKTPSVRNAELSGPYMHNGGMKTLEDVLDFYNAGGGQGLGLDVPNQTLPPDSLGLSRRDMDDVIAFIKSLTDTTGIGAQPRPPAGY